MRIATALLLLLAAPLVWATPTASPASAVHVRYDHPSQFTEFRASPASKRSDIEDRMALLKRYIEQRAARTIRPGDHLSIVVTDLAFAGNYEPWNQAPGGWIRVIRSTYPPRIDLHFTLTDAQGKVLRQGTRKLRDAGFMQTPGLNDSDPIRYTKALVNRWLRHGVDAL